MIGHIGKFLSVRRKNRDWWGKDVSQRGFYSVQLEDRLGCIDGIPVSTEGGSNGQRRRLNRRRDVSRWQAGVEGLQMNPTWCMGPSRKYTEVETRLFFY